MSPITTRYRTAIEEELRRNVKGFLPSADPVYGMMRYFLGWQDERGQAIDDPRARGKRFRPTIMLLVSEAVAGTYQEALPFAAAIELFHNFTLIHDDIEDHDEYRRHKPTVWKLYGLEHAINAGDGMLVLANQAALRSNHPRRMDIMRIMNGAWVTIFEGQYLDMSFEKRDDVTVEEYLTMIEGKTGVLVGLAAQVGAYVATDNKNIIEQYRRFGLNFGLAYQVIDDIDSVWGTSDDTGKVEGGDIRKRKKTLPYIYALSKLDAQYRAELISIYNGSHIGDKEVRRVVKLFDDVDAKSFCVQMGESYKKQALAALIKTGVSNATQDELKRLLNTIVG